MRGNQLAGFLLALLLITAAVNGREMRANQLAGFLLALLIAAITFVYSVSEWGCR